MDLAASRVTRTPRQLAWSAVVDNATIGSAKCFVRPDDRCFLFFDSWRADSFAPLVEAVAADIERDLFVTVDGADLEAVARYEQLGFAVHRRESEFLVPTDPTITGLGEAAIPPGFDLISALEAEEARLRLLDDALRQDVPGTDGWRWSEAAFREETFSAEFDPDTYLVAVERDRGAYAGLVRVWNKPIRPRLGLIAVLAPYRRRGLARALLAQVFAVLHGRGKREVSAEVDESNAESLSLIESLGARRSGGTVELVRPHGPRC